MAGRVLDYNRADRGMSVDAGEYGGWPQGPRRKDAQHRPRSRWDRTCRPPWGVPAHRALLLQLRCAEVAMKRRLPAWAILAGVTAVAAAAFFASTGVTHWVMSLHSIEVVVRPGPTVYVPIPAGQGHVHKRARPDPAPAGPAGGGGVQPRLDANVRADHGDAHARADHGDPQDHGDWPDHGYGPDHGDGSDHGDRGSQGSHGEHHHGRHDDRHAQGHDWPARARHSCPQPRRHGPDCRPRCDRAWGKVRNAAECTVLPSGYERGLSRIRLVGGA